MMQSIPVKAAAPNRQPDCQPQTAIKLQQSADASSHVLALSLGTKESQLLFKPL